MRSRSADAFVVGPGDGESGVEQARDDGVTAGHSGQLGVTVRRGGRGAPIGGTGGHVTPHDERPSPGRWWRRRQ
ncbi:hypothetical protein [Rhodococcoides yunnanense]|uniref:hypothetical protein n=1 Tax=Rhodococcoides yunnanense TaxID=278209 RepID=UPI0022B0EDFC|nr:hypothetical protein [Rhodococcus yunnanensis]MCZ4277093.1 hypothetical protein [Rhodococcus yunnanensis]